ncbi:MAG: ABC transporter ATP-binding protein [Muribaculaceae bacterium]|nr:ABC transporter ATP-binding protein [Muribaculaceae bacterium]
MKEHDTILTTDNLAVGYRNGKQQVTLLQGLNLSLEKGRLVALLGQNGAGKSTLLRAITADERPLDGTISVNGKNLLEMSQKDRSRLIGLVSTERIQAGALTVTELVGLGRQPHTGFLGRLDDEDREVVRQAMSDAGIIDKANEYMASLSDGERQKAMIARALAQQTPIIILDEPTAFLDVASRIETMRLLQTLAHDRGKAVLLSSHDISQSLMLADELWLITTDRQVLTGTTRQLVADGAMDRLFANRDIRFNSNILDYSF